ncbi:hypothetical protein J6590_066564 [Homalodisca vitripennis]|nr:hypothetical protein J6590_066564 [Homalodisca vitripennis]
MRLDLEGNIVEKTSTILSLKHFVETLPILAPEHDYEAITRLTKSRTCARFERPCRQEARTIHVVDRVYLDDGLIRLLVSAIRGGTILPVVRYLAIIQQPLANRFARQTGGRMWPEPAASVTNGVFVGTKAPAGLRLAQLPRSQYRRRSGRGEMAASTLSQIVALALLPLLAAVAERSGRVACVTLPGLFLKTKHGCRITLSVVSVTLCACRHSCARGRMLSELRNS